MWLKVLTIILILFLNFCLTGKKILYWHFCTILCSLPMTNFQILTEYFETYGAIIEVSVIDCFCYFSYFSRTYGQSLKMKKYQSYYMNFHLLRLALTELISCCFFLWLRILLQTRLMTILCYLFLWSFWLICRTLQYPILWAEYM